MATVRYLVDDVEAATRFYTERLGFEVAERWGGALTIVTRGDLRLLLSGPLTSAARPMPDGSKPVPGGWNRLVIEVRDLPSLMETLRTAGVRFRSDLVTGPGGRQALAEDPAGNPIELFEPTRS
jgi:catechol 2,3-dioxygenase-like lactoylglutathione lyase family enzyme